MSVKVTTVETEISAKKARARKFTRPTTPEVEALYFKVAVKLTQREQALFMYAMGRSGDDGQAFLDLVLHPSGDPA